MLEDKEMISYPSLFHFSHKTKFKWKIKKDKVINPIFFRKGEKELSEMLMNKTIKEKRITIAPKYIIIK